MKSMKLFAASAVLVFAVLSLVGCGSTGDKDPSKLGSVEKAQAVTRLRKEAEICLQQFVASEGDEDGINIDALLCYVEKLKITTKIYPNPNLCSSCYAQYGEGLRMLGGYYRTLSLKQGESATRAGPERQAALKKLSEENDQKAERNYRLALTQFNLHVASGQVLNWVYWKGFEVSARLEQFTMALKYLKLFEQNNTLDVAEKAKLKKWREWTDKRIKKQLRDRVREELK